MLAAVDCLHCSRPVLSRGLCNAHYKRLRKYGDPLGGAERATCAAPACSRRVVVSRNRTGLCRYHTTRAWKKANADKVNAANRRYNAAHPEVAARCDANYNAANPHASADRAAVRRARKTGQFVERVYRTKVLRSSNGRCGICGEPVDASRFHVDHIVPLSRGGEHSYANTQPAHPVCNVRKGDRCDAF